MNRLSLSVLALVLAISVVGAGCAQVTPRLTQQEPGIEQRQEALAMGVLVTDDGAATVTRGDVTAKATADMELLPGDTVKVTEGTVAIAYPGAGAAYLENGTEVTVLPDGEGTGSVFTQIDLAAGSIWTRFERLLGADERFSVTGNGVVATVRGTAFGMEVVGEDVDLQVADHEIEVTLLGARKNAQLLKKAMRLKNGEGLRIGAQTMMHMEAAGMQKLVRRLSDADTKKPGYQVMSKPVKEKLMDMHAKTKMNGKPTIPERFRDRLDAAMMQRIEDFADPTPSFTAPDRTIRPSEIAPTTTPSSP